MLVPTSAVAAWFLRGDGDPGVAPHPSAEADSAQLDDGHRPEVTADQLTDFDPLEWDYDLYTGPRVPITELTSRTGDVALDGDVRQVEAMLIIDGKVTIQNPDAVAPIPAVIRNVHFEGGNTVDGACAIQTGHSPAVEGASPDDILAEYVSMRGHPGEAARLDGVGSSGPITLRFADVDVTNDGVTNRINRYGLTRVEYSRFRVPSEQMDHGYHPDGLQWVAGSMASETHVSEYLGSKSHRNWLRGNEFASAATAHVLIQSEGLSTGHAPGRSDLPAHDILIEHNVFRGVPGHVRHLYVIPGRSGTVSSTSDAHGVPISDHGGDRRPWYVTIRGNRFEGRDVLTADRVARARLCHTMTADTGEDYAVFVRTEEERDDLVAAQLEDPALIAERVASGIPWYSADARTFVVWSEDNTWVEDGEVATPPMWGGSYYQGP